MIKLSMAFTLPSEGCIKLQVELEGETTKRDLDFATSLLEQLVRYEPEESDAHLNLAPFPKTPSPTEAKILTWMLANENEWVAAKEISSGLDIPFWTVQSCLQRLEAYLETTKSSVGRGRPPKAYRIHADALDKIALNGIKLHRQGREERYNDSSERQ